MSVPPASRRPSSTPSSKGRPDEDKKSDKEFKLPPKKQDVGGKEEEQKKKGLFEIASQEMTGQEKQGQVSQDLKTEAVKAGEITAAAAVQQVSQVSQLIQRMVETMHIGQLNAQDFARMTLKASAEVPPSFAGSSLTLSYQENGLVIHFDNFMSPQQQNTAITLVERHKEQLEQMVQALNTKNIQVAEMKIGTHNVALPKVAPLPPPFQPTPATQTEAEQQREQREGGREGREGDGGGGGPRR